jgi:hypothetical protein
MDAIMGIFDTLFDIISTAASKKTSSSGSFSSGIINYGESKQNGGHDHRYNKGNDRTQAQKEGDKKKTKN